MFPGDMSKNLIAKAAISIKAPSTRVWDALVTPAAIKQYMFGTNVVSAWKEGSAIVWEVVGQGKALGGKGEILQPKPAATPHDTHPSPVSRHPDWPGSYPTLPIERSAQRPE